MTIQKFYYICTKYAIYCSMDIRRTLKERRQMLGVTQQEIADITALSLRTIIATENEQANPSLSTLQKIASALGMEITAVIKQPEKK